MFRAHTITRFPAALGLLAAGLLASGAAAETRCGWYHNPTPANHWLDDADASWELSLQGAGAAPGFDELPASAWEFGAEWVEVNGYYGYGCACMEGVFGDPASGTVIRIESLRPIPLARCRADAALPPVSD